MGCMTRTKLVQVSYPVQAQPVAGNCPNFLNLADSCAITCAKASHPFQKLQRAKMTKTNPQPTMAVAVGTVVWSAAPPQRTVSTTKSNVKSTAVASGLLAEKMIQT